MTMPSSEPSTSAMPAPDAGIGGAANGGIRAPTSEAEAAAIIQEAHRDGTRLAIAGRGSKAGIGRPAAADRCLGSLALAGVTFYEPSEMVVSAHAGTSLSALVAHLGASGQRLTFEPPDPAMLFGGDGEQTIGGIVAANWSGPRRIQAGACRDSLIGVRFVNGRGEIVKSGGRVMKNVTGLDLVKLMAGSWGTLGFLTEVTLKVAPVPETEATLAFTGLDERRAVAALCRALGSPYGVSGAAHMPAGWSEGRVNDPPLTLLRLEGSAFSVRHRAEALAAYLSEFGAPAVLAQDDGRFLWAGVRDGAPVAFPADRAVWRLSTAPMRGPDVVAAIRAQRDIRTFYDWGGGLVWLSTPADGDAGAAVVRGAVAAHGGHATLIRAPLAVRAAVAVFQPEPDPLARIAADLKRAFDPAGILEVGRIVADS